MLLLMKPTHQIKAPHRNLTILSTLMQLVQITFLTLKAGQEKIGSLTAQPNPALAEDPAGSHAS